MRTKIRVLFAQDHEKLVGHEFTIKGWIKTVRNQKTNTFIEVNDSLYALSHQTNSAPFAQLLMQQLLFAAQI